MFVLIHGLREFHLSSVTNHCEFRCQSKQPMLMYYKSTLLKLRSDGIAMLFSSICLSLCFTFFLYADEMIYDFKIFLVCFSADNFFERFESCQDGYRQEELRKLRCITKKEHMFSSNEILELFRYV